MNKLTKLLIIGTQLGLALLSFNIYFDDEGNPDYDAIERDRYYYGK
jgi:hypothetical protein